MTSICRGVGITSGQAARTPSEGLAARGEKGGAVRQAARASSHRPSGELHEGQRSLNAVDAGLPCPSSCARMTLTVAADADLGEKPEEQ